MSRVGLRRSALAALLAVGAALLVPRTAPLAHPAWTPRQSVAMGDATARAAAITAPKRIEAVRRVFNALPASRPHFGVESCPAGIGDVLLAFYKKPRTTGTPRALVDVTVGGCGGVAVAIDGRRSAGRETDDAPARIGKLAHMSLEGR